MIISLGKIILADEISYIISVLPNEGTESFSSWNGEGKSHFWADQQHLEIQESLLIEKAGVSFKITMHALN